MRTLLVALAASVVACSGPPESSDDPLSGSINGTAFEPLGSYAETRNGVLYVTLTNIASSCGAPPQPATSLLRLDITMPPQTQTIGSFPLGSGDASPRASVTWFTDATSGLHQNTVTIETGTLEIQNLGASAAGSLVVTNAKAALSGRFGAELCR